MKVRFFMLCERSALLEHGHAGEEVYLRAYGGSVLQECGELPLNCIRPVDNNPRAGECRCCIGQVRSKTERIIALGEYAVNAGLSYGGSAKREVILVVYQNIRPGTPAGFKKRNFHLPKKRQAHHDALAVFSAYSLFCRTPPPIQRLGDGTHVFVERVKRARQ